MSRVIKLAVIPGDGIGPEVMAQAERVLECLKQHHGFEVEWRFGLIGGALAVVISLVRGDVAIEFWSNATVPVLVSVGMAVSGNCEVRSRLVRATCSSSSRR